jgi:hypothetical protein
VGVGRWWRVWRRKKYGEKNRCSTSVKHMSV